MKLFVFLKKSRFSQNFPTFFLPFSYLFWVGRKPPVTERKTYILSYLSYLLVIIMVISYKYKQYMYRKIGVEKKVWGGSI